MPKCYDDKTPLHVASQGGHVDAVRALLEHGAHVNSQDCDMWMPLHFASFGGNIKVVQLLLEHGGYLNVLSIADDSPLRLASSRRHLEVVRLLLDHGADVDLGPNLTSYQVATIKGYDDVAELLLEYGAQDRKW